MCFKFSCVLLSCSHIRRYFGCISSCGIFVRLKSSWKRRLQQIRTSLSLALDSLDSLLEDLQKPASREYRFADSKNQKSPLLSRCLGIKNNISQVMSSIGRDLETLALTTATVNATKANEKSKKNTKNGVLTANFIIS